jgi:hypothetical protein
MKGFSPREIPIDYAINYSTNALVKNMYHRQGDNYALVEKSGLYDISVDNITDEPAQWTVFINNIPEPTVIFGRESGAARVHVRQILKLNHGDKVDIRNHTSNAGTLHSAVNPGGNYPGINKSFSLILLTPTCEPETKPHCEPKPDCKKDKCKN